MLRVAALLALSVAAPIPDVLPDRLVLWSVPLAEGAKGNDARQRASAGAWHPDGRHVVTAGWSEITGPMTGEVRVWDVATGKHVRTLRGSAASYHFRAGHLAVSPDGKTVAAGGTRGGANDEKREHFVEVWDWSAERPRAKLGGFSAHVSGVTFSPDGHRLLAVDYEGNLNGWEATTGRQVLRATVESGWAFGLAHHPRHPILVGADWDGDIRFLDAATGTVVAPAPAIPRLLRFGYTSAAVAPDGRAVAFGASEHSAKSPLVVIPVRVTETGAVTTGEPIQVTDRVDGCVYQVAYSPDGKVIAAACQDKTVRLYAADGAVLSAVATEHSGPVFSVAFSPDGRRLFSVGTDAVKVWSVAELRKCRPAP